MENREKEFEGVLEVPDGKSVMDMTVGHFENLIDTKGRSTVIRALTNLQNWNKNKNPKLSRWAYNMKNKLEGYGETNESRKLNEESDKDFVLRTAKILGWRAAEDDDSTVFSKPGSDAKIIITWGERPKLEVKIGDLDIWAYIYKNYKELSADIARVFKIYAKASAAEEIYKSELNKIERKFARKWKITQRGYTSFPWVYKRGDVEVRVSPVSGYKTTNIIRSDKGGIEVDTENLASEFGDFVADV